MNAQCIMVCSGKGGTGKSTVSVLLGACLARLGRKTLLVELDSGLRSVDIIAGVYGRTVYDIEDVLCGRCEGAKAVVPSPLYPGLSVISAPYEGGAVEAAPLGRLLTAMRPYFDFILLDTAAGMGAPFTAASTVADKALLVLTPDPVALRDGKIVADRLLAGGRPQSAVRLVMNRVRRESFGKNAAVADLDECIDTVGVLTQYRPLELNRYIGNGQPWDLDRSDGGVHILPPYQSAKGATWFKGTANASYQNIGFVDMYDPDYVLILSGDHIYKMDYAAMLAHHKRVHADCTIAVMEVPWDEASRFGIMNVDGEDTITEFEEKPKQPRSNLASMGIYVFSWKKLRAYLIADENDAGSSNDFGKNIIPAMLNAGEKMSAYRFEGYWKDVGTLDSLWDANMDMLAQGSGLNLLDKDWPIYARAESEPPAYLGETAEVDHSVVTRGSEGEGAVRNSVLSQRCTVAEGAEVEYSILMPGAVVERGARVAYAILGENVRVGENARVGASPEAAPPEEWGITVVGPEAQVEAGRTLKANRMLNREGKETVR